MDERRKLLHFVSKSLYGKGVAELFCKPTESHC